MTDTVTPIEAPQKTTERQNYEYILSRLMETRAVLRMVEDRDGPHGLDELGRDELVCYATYELAVGAVRRTLDALHEEVDVMNTEAGRAQS